LDSSVQSRPNHYETLGLTPTASDDDVEEAFATKSRKHIEEAWVNAPEWRERGRQIRIAHETLRDPVQRQAYDNSLGLTSDPEPHRPEAPAEPSAAPFVAATPQKPVKSRARGASPDLESQRQMERRSKASADQSPDQHVREAPPDSVKGTVHDSAPDLPPQQERQPEAPTEQSAGAFMAATAWKLEKQHAHEAELTSQRESRRPKAPAEPYVAPLIAAALRDPVKRREYYTSPGRSPQPEPQQRPEAPLEGSPDPHIGRTDELRGTDVGSSTPDSVEPRTKLNRRAAGVGALLIAIALFTLLMWPPGGNADRSLSPPGGRTAARADGPRIGSNAMTQAPQQTLPVQESTSPVPEETDGSVYGSVAPSDIGPVPTRIAPAASSARASASIPQGAMETQPAPQEETAATELATGPAAAPPSAAGDQSLPATGTQAVVSEAARTAPAPALKLESPAKLTGGSLVASDNRRGRFEGTVSVQFTVEPSGQVTGCRPTASSGNPALDARTCELVAQKLQFSPALDAQGRPIASEMHGTYTWGRKRRTLTGRLLDVVRKRRP